MMDVTRTMDSRKLPFAEFALVLTIIYLVQSTDAMKNESFHSTWNIGDNAEVFFAKNQFAEKDAFVFAVCDKGVKCYVMLPPKNTTADQSLDRKTCTLNIELEPGKQFPNGRFSLDLGYLVDSNNVVAAWDEFEVIDKENFDVQKKVAIIDTSSCTTKKLVFSYNLIEGELASVQGQLMSYQKTFDVIMADKSKCGTFQKCRMTFDQEGKQVGDVHQFLLDNVMPVKLETVKPLSPSDGFFMVGFEDIIYSDGRLAARFVNESGSSFNFSTDIKANGALQLGVPVSASHGLYSFCGVNHSFDERDEKSIVNCSQYRHDSVTPHLNAIVNLPLRIRSLTLYNLQDGGFLLFALNCNEASGDLELIVDKVLPDGKKLESFEFSLGTECANGEKTFLNIERFNGDEYCAYAAYTSKSPPSPSFYDDLNHELPVSQPASTNGQTLHWLKKCVALKRVFE